ncbi:hypothetical protein [Arenimonas sp.]|uniref:hypothetical protein n=1 Tax=Arenimonas sp. TaxID=1872635 RepID=UPI0039E553DB
MRHRHRSRVAFATLSFSSLILLAGCTTTGIRSVSSLGSDAEGATARPLGVSYYLPMRYAKVTFTRVKADDKADKAFTEATAALKEAETKLAGAKAAALAQAEWMAEMKKSGIKETDAPYIAALAELVKLRQAEVAAAKDVATAKAKADQAEAAALQLADAKAMCGWSDAVQVQLLDFVPDTSARYLLQPQSSAFRSDTFKMTTTTSGLLQTANIEQKDESGEVLINLARSIAAWSGPSPLANSMFSEMLDSPFKGLMADGNRCKQLAWEPRKLEFVIDPANAGEWARVGASISQSARVRGIGVAADEAFDYELSLATRSAAMVSSEQGLATRRTGDGIYYRRERPLVVNIELKDAKGLKQSIGNVLLMVPNEAPVDALDMEATAFVTNKSNYGFSNGMLVSVDNARPSPAVAIVSVPWKISEATLTQIRDLLTLRVDITQKKKTVATEEAALLQQMKAIVEAQEALDEAKKKAAEE